MKQYEVSGKSIFLLDSSSLAYRVLNTINRLLFKSGLKVEFSTLREDLIHMNIINLKVKIINFDITTMYEVPIKFYFDDLLIFNFMDCCDIKKRYNEKEIIKTIKFLINEILKDFMEYSFSSNKYHYDFEILKMIKYTVEYHNVLMIDDVVFGRFLVSFFDGIAYQYDDNEFYETLV